jgi:hypothetical protein
MTHEYVLWIATAAYGFHILEEYELNWQGWAVRVLKLPVDWNSFYVVNPLVALFGICSAMVGWRRPEFALSFPAVMIVNATVFHVVPVLRTGFFSPGVVTSLILFFPIAACCYYGAWLDGALDALTVITSAVRGVLFMALPVVLLKIRRWDMFRYGAPPA